MSRRASPKNILLVFESPLSQCPRARRLLNFLEKNHDVKYLCKGEMNEVRSDTRYRFLKKVLQPHVTRWLSRLYVSINWLSAAVAIEHKKLDVGFIEDGEFDYIFLHDLYFLPKFYQFKKTKVVFDARECYPLQFGNIDKWRKTKGKLARYILKKYVPSINTAVTVSPSLVDYYEALTHRKFLLFPSYPDWKLLLPYAKDKNLKSPVTLIHHGLALEKRGLEIMFDLMAKLGGGYRLDMMLVANANNPYYLKLKNLAANSTNIRIIDPVPSDKIIQFCGKYDLGIFLMIDNGSQNKWCLPNKYFEFLFSGLPVITSCSVDMAKYTEAHDIGLGFTDESLEHIANEIRAIDQKKIQKWRKNIYNNVAQWTISKNVERCFPDL